MTDSEKAEKQIEIQYLAPKPRQKQTCIIGVPEEDAKQLTKDLKRQLGCGGRFAENESKIVLQGDFRYKIPEILKRKYKNHTIKNSVAKENEQIG